MSIAQTLMEIQDRYDSLPAAVHTEDPRTVLSRIAANAFWTKGRPPHERALTLAALGLALLVAVDRADTVDITSGNEAA